jgi:GT2 family glycosyltransferase
LEVQEARQVTETAGSQTELSPRPSVVIINYNGLRFLEELLTSLQGQTLSPFHTLLIDNASKDESVSFVRTHFGWVEVLPQHRNLGFARAGNLGMGHVQGEFAALLNTDMRLEPTWLAELVKPALADPQVAAVASKLLLYSDPARLNGVGGVMNYLGYTWDRGMFELDEGQYDQPAQVLFASAGAALFRRSVFLESGGFDERFFMYHEDVDLGWRLWLLGLRVVTAPQAVAYHHFGGSTRQERGLDWRELIGDGITSGHF